MTDPKDLQQFADFPPLLAKIAANQKLVDTLRVRIAEFQSGPAKTAAGSQAPAPDFRKAIRYSAPFRLTTPREATDSRIVEALMRQQDDASLAGYPSFAIRLGARIHKADLRLALPEDDDLRRPGGIRRMLRKHLAQARHANAPSRTAVAIAWLRALASALAERTRARPPIPPEFDEITYLLLHRDVAQLVAVGDIRSGYAHWLHEGKEEGRLARIHLPTASCGPPSPPPSNRTGGPAAFDEDAYLFHNADVAAAVRARLFASGYNHWSRIGRREGRGGGVPEDLPERSTFLPLLDSRPYGVNLYGFLSTVSGLGAVARSCSAALESAAIPLRSIDIPAWEQPAERTVPGFSPYRINLIQQNADMLPRFFDAYGKDLLKGCYNIGYWLWELPSLRSDWHHLYRYVDEIWVASDFCRQAFQSLTPLPVRCVPLVVDGLDEKVTYPRAHFGFPEDAFVFAYIFDVSSYMDRKNPFCLIEAFRRAFGTSRDVLLYLKFFNSGYDETNVRALEEAIAGAPNIRSYQGVMNEREIASLHKAVDCLVSPHRSEGFGYNLAEAMYFGKPVIATRYSSNLDFMRDENSYLIDCALVPIPENIGPYRRGQVWADPSTEHLSYLMRTVFENPGERTAKGRRAAEEIRTHYSVAAAGRVIADRLEELGLNAASVPTSIFKRHPDTVPRLFHAATPAAVADEIRGWMEKPVISVVTPVFNAAGAYLRRCIESVRAQWYPYWELCLCDDGSTDAKTLAVLDEYRGIDPRIRIVRSDRNQGIAAASNRAAEISTGEYLAMLDNDDEVTPDALFEVAKVVHEYTDVEFLYTDEDKVSEDGRIVDHYCKPDWSPEHLLSVMYLLHLLVIQKTLFYTLGGFRPEFSGAQDYDLALRASTRAHLICHIPKILYHWRAIRGSAAEAVDAKPAALEAGRRALEDHVIRNGIDADVEEGLLPGLFRVRNRIRGNPLASLCILAGGRRAIVEGRGEIDLLSNFVASIVHRTEYPNYEIVIVDDGALPERARRALAGLPYRIEHYAPPEGPFNFSRKANFAFRQARGRHILLLNDDLEVISPEWLTAMLEPLQQDTVGVVGARLLFPDGRLQHGGVVLGINDSAAHVYHGYPASFVGYNAFTHVIRNYSAVTAACLATRTDVIEATGGFDEQLGIDYNDIDFCLSAIRHGYRIVYTPYAEMYHFEGSSIQRKEANVRDTMRFQLRWREYVRDDPYYNPNLTRKALDFSIDEEGIQP